MMKVRLGRLTFPIAPAKITVTEKSRNRTVTLLDGTRRVIGKAPHLSEIRMELMLPRSELPFSHYEDGFLPPETFLETLREYARAGECVTLVITRGEKSTARTVYVGDAETCEDARAGGDVTLTLTLTACDETAGDAIPETWTVREGDTLRIIAKRVWGDETLWNYLYGFNVDAIEAAAQAAGYADSRFGERLMAGIRLVIPQEVRRGE